MDTPFVLPGWAVVIIGILVIFGSLSGLYTIYRLSRDVTETVALLRKITPSLSKLDKLDALDELAEFGSVLFAIAKEFKNDSGSSLKDTVEELAKARKIDSDAAEILRGKVSDIRAEQVMLALQDRRQPAIALHTTNISGEVQAGKDFVGRDAANSQTVAIAPGEQVNVKGVTSPKE